MQTSAVRYERCSPTEASVDALTQVAEVYGKVFSGPPWNEQFWSVEQILADMRHEITPAASCWISRAGESVTGFCWGYPVSLRDLETKLGVSLLGTVPDSERIAYQDELGVLQEYRNNSVARTLFRLRLEDFLRQGLTYGIVRTLALPQPSVTYLWFTQKLGYEVLVSYPDDGRVVLGAPLARVAQLLGG